MLLKKPDQPLPLKVTLFIPAKAPARTVRIVVDGAVLAEETFPAPGAYTLSTATPYNAAHDPVTMQIQVDRTFTSPPDTRQLGVVLSAVGFQ